MTPERTRLAILISGRGSNMAALIYAAQNAECPYEPVLVSGDNPDAPGFDHAKAEGVRVERIVSKGAAFWKDLQAALEAVRTDMIALAGFMRIIPDDFLTRWEGRVVNIHPSLLPKYKGLGVHEAVLAAGDSKTGASVHLVTPELDSGEILGQVEVAVMEGDTPESLADRVLIAEHQLYPQILTRYLNRERDPDWLAHKVGELALALPETHYKTSHGAPAWRVGSKSSGKNFAIMWMKSHGEESVAVLVKCSGQDEMAALIEAQPDLYFRPQYYGPADWIGLRIDLPGTDWEHVSEWLRRSWQACAPARLTKLARAADQF